jgi:hypothetical protein
MVTCEASGWTAVLLKKYSMMEDGDFMKLVQEDDNS